MINKKEKELKIGLMDQNMMVNIKMVLNQEKENYYFQMVVGMKANFMIMKFRVLEFINGLMEDNMRAND